MTTHPSTDDLRDELRRQATATESWELPAVPRPQRRTSPWRAGGAVLVSAVLVVGVLLVPSWLEGDQDVAGREVTPPSSPGSAPGIERLDWEQTGPTCLADTPQCVVPQQVVSDGLALELTVMNVGGPVGPTAAPTSYRHSSSDPQASPDETWVMVGYLEDDRPVPAPGMTVDLGIGTVEVAPSQQPFALFRVRGDLADPYVVKMTSPDAPVGGKAVIARFAPSTSGPRPDWVSTTDALEPCGVSARCLATSSVVLDGVDLVRSADGAEGAGDLRGEFRRPLPGAWFMLGASAPDDGGPLLVSVGDGESVSVPVDRPVLVRAPDGTRPAYRVRTEDGRALPLFMWVYRPADG